MCYDTGICLIGSARAASYYYYIRVQMWVPRARAENKANQHCHFKSSRWCIELLDTDSYRGTVPMEPPMSNSAMHHREPKNEIDD